jgi:ABC-2 type transport system ATP-binding protein
MVQHPGTATDVAVRVRGLDVRRGDKRVLPGIDLDVRRGAVTALLGPSGSGKSTLIRAIVGVQVVAGGRIDVLGRAAGDAELRRSVAYVTQSPSVYADLTVRENLRYFARIVDVRARRIDEVVETVGLHGQIDQVVATLSGGERSRASLGARCSAIRTSSCSTSRRSGWTRCCATSCGRRSTR